MKCTICNEPTKDCLVYGYKKGKILFWETIVGKITKPFCRKHLLMEFKKHFLEFTGKIVVFYPELERKHGSYVYGGMTLKEMRKQKLPPEEITLIENSLKIIKGNCSKCTKSTQVAYYGQGILKWESGDWDYPILKDICVKPELLCTKCAVEAIEYSLKSFKDNFIEGLFIPFATDSMLVSFPI